MENANFDIFGSQAADINTHRSERKESMIYAPKAKDTADGIYEAKIRFLYNPADPENGSIIKKVTYYLKDQEDQGHYFDSPQSIGKFKECPIGQLWYKLKDSESALDRKNSEELNKRNVFYSLVYIIDDKSNPSLNGKIKIFKYGVKVKAKLDRYLEPKSGPKQDIFNFYTGRDFDMYITKQGNFNDYSETDFSHVESQITLPGLTGEASDREILQKLMSSAPDLEEYRYKPWNDEERAKLDKILSQYRSPGESISNIVADKGTDDTPDPMISAINETSSDNVTETPKAKATTSEAPTATVEAKDENLDDFLDNLGI